MIRVIDFFSGCGGTSKGLADAGMEIVLGIDHNSDAITSFQLNHPNATTLNSDIQDVDVEDIARFMPRDGAVLFAGCAPCQPFSRQSRDKSPLDPRFNLLAEFERFVVRWLPDYVLVENVPGLQRVDEAIGPLSRFKATLARLGYRHASAVVRASAYGVPQTRERLILLASRHGRIDVPAGVDGPVSTVREWIGHLPPIAAGEKHFTDPEHEASRLSEINLRRIRQTPEGGGRESWDPDLWLDCHRGHSGHSDVYGRLAWDRPAAGLTTRCISYSNGRFGHPTQDRAISVREAACLQTFPDDYRFAGTKTAKAVQIGNAVPPRMARAIGEALQCHHQISHPRSADRPDNK